jgi:hypothetical protein
VGGWAEDNQRSYVPLLLSFFSFFWVLIRAGVGSGAACDGSKGLRKGYGAETDRSGV